MANRFWISGVAANFNLAANWSTTSGGGGGASVPAASDTAIFDGSGLGNCRLDVAISIAALDMQAAYTGTIDGATDDLNHAVSGDITLAGTQFDAGDGTWTIGGNWDNSALTTFTAGAGRITFTGTSKTFTGAGTGGGQRLGHVTVAVGASYTIQTNDTWWLGTDIQLLGGITIPAGRELWTGNTTNAYTTTFGASSSITGAGKLLPLGNLVTNPGATQAGLAVMLLLGTPTPFGTIGAGTWNPDVFKIANNGTGPRGQAAAAGTLIFSNDFTFSQASSVGSGELDCATNDPDITIGGDCTLEDGAGTGNTFSAGSGTMTVSGHFDASTLSTYSAGGGTLVMDGVAKNLTPPSDALESVVIESAGNVSLALRALTCQSLRVKNSATLDPSGQGIGTTSGAIQLDDGAVIDPVGLGNTTWTIADRLRILGTMTAPVALKPATAGTITQNGAQAGEAHWADLQNVDCSGGVLLHAIDNCRDVGGNQHVAFNRRAQVLNSPVVMAD